MPPQTTGRSLSQKDIDTIRRWIDQGAQWNTHWAYTAPVRPELPSVKNPKWARNPIDHFILARLERESLKPSPETDKVTLIRRVTFDLTGLPPTPDEIDAFVKDRSADAYETVVDRLLHRRDTANVWPCTGLIWRVIPTRTDTTSIAIATCGPGATGLSTLSTATCRTSDSRSSSLRATFCRTRHGTRRSLPAFNRNHMINFEGGAIPEEYLNEYVVDRVDTVSTVWMGMTMGCARCHDHKYDPIKQKEFYQLYAFFNRVPEKGLDGRGGNAEPFLTLPTAEQEVKVKELQSAIKAHEKALAESIVGPVQKEWEKTRVDALPPEPREGLVAHYALDGSFADISGNYRHGRVLTGDVTYGEGRVAEGVTSNGEARIDLGNTGRSIRTGHSRSRHGFDSAA